MAVTMRDIAKASGYSKTAVWMALSNNHRIPEKTRTAIRKVARSLGYKPNAAYAQMLRQVRAGKPVSYKSTIGLLHALDTPDPGKTYPYHREIVEGIHQRAKELGYGIDSFWINEPNLSLQRLQGILQARSIQGLLVTPMAVHRRINLDWKKFTTATIGYTLLGLRLNRVHVNNQQASAICLRKLFGFGYQRIGLVMRSDHEYSRQYELCAPYFWLQNHLPARDRTPIFTVGKTSSTQFLRWFEKGRFDALISTHPDVVEWLEAAGKKIPRDVGIVFPTPVPVYPEYARILHCPQRLGSAAVDMVIAQLNRGEVGPPTNPKTIHTDVGWKEGNSIRKVGPPQPTNLLDSIVSLPSEESHEMIFEGAGVIP